MIDDKVNFLETLPLEKAEGKDQGRLTLVGRSQPKGIGMLAVVQRNPHAMEKALIGITLRCQHIRVEV